MRPPLRLAQFAHQAALGGSQRLAEDVVPLVPHNGQQRCNLPFGLVFRAKQVQRLTNGRFRLVEPHLCMLCLQLALDERAPSSVAQQIQHFADTFVIGDRHAGIS